MVTIYTKKAIGLELLNLWLFSFVMVFSRLSMTSATERLESLELQAQRLRAQYHLSAVELLLYELLLKVVYAVRSQ